MEYLIEPVSLNEDLGAEPVAKCWDVEGYICYCVAPPCMELMGRVE